MKLEQPPIVEEEERFEGHEVNPLATAEQIELEKKEQKLEAIKITTSPEDEEEIAKLQYDLSVNRTIEAAVAKKPKGDEEGVFYSAPKQQNKWKNAMMAARIGIAGLFGFSATGAKANAELPNDSTKNKIEVSKKTPEDSLATNKNTATIKVYQGGKTKEGATTPTGFNNSFENNEYNIHEGDVESIAKQFGFRTSSVEDFQTDMFGYLEKNFPNDMKAVVKKYGMPAAGKMTDNILGIRAGFAISLLKNKVPGNPEVSKESDPYAAFAESGEVMYAPGTGGHAVAEICYPVRNSTSITDGGMLDASKQNVLIRFRNDFGKTGEVVVLNDEDFRKLIGTTNHFQNQEQIDELKKNSSKIANK